MSYTRLALLSTAVSLCLCATPVFAQTFNGYNSNDAAVTQGYAPYEHPADNGWNNGPPVIGPVVGVLTAPVRIATGGWAEPGSACYVDRDFNGRYTALCGL
jgi:hypothetical protein